MPELTDVDAWLSEGEYASSQANERSMLLIAGEDSTATALVALGIARVQARKRRVALIDLTNDAPPLRELVTDDDPHGIVDTMLHGVSLARVSRQVDEEGHLFVIPTGSQPPDEDVVSHERWRRLRATFRESHSLAIVVATPGLPALETLAEHADGVVVVGPAARMRNLPNIVETLPTERAAGVAHSSTGTISAAAKPSPADDEASGERLTEPVADEVTAPASTPAEEATSGAAPVAEEAAEASEAVTVAQSADSATHTRAPRMTPMEREPRRPMRWIAAGAIVVLIAVIWLFVRTGRADESAVPTPAASGTTSREASGAVDTTAETVVDFRDRARVANPADSVRATAFSVELVSATSDASAWRFLVNSPTALPASSVSPVTIAPDTTRWFRVVAGAYTTSSRADSLLRAARASGVMGDDAGRVIRAPIALRVSENLAAATAADRVRSLRQREIGAYSLQQDDDRFHVYVGAFETPQQAQFLAGRLRSDGVETTIAYRTGRLD